MFKKSLKSQSGQALVLVLLTLAVTLTLVLFILSRTVTDIAVSSREEEALRAFSAAEAGIEKALIVGSSTGLTAIGDATFNAQVSDYAKGTNAYNYPLNLFSGESATIWFVAHESDGDVICNAQNPCFSGSRMKICWGKPGTPGGAATTPAAEISIFYTTAPGDYTRLRIGRLALDPNSSRRSSNSFAAPDSGTCTIGSESYAFQKTFNFSDLGIPAASYNNDNGLQFARLRMFYHSDQSQTLGFDVGFAGGDPLPSQGLNIDSSGTSGEANRRLTVFQGWPEPPSVFDFAVYSSSGLVK